MGSGIVPLPISFETRLDPAENGFVANSSPNELAPGCREVCEALIGTSDQLVEVLAVLALDPLLQLRVDVHGHLRIGVPDLSHHPLEVVAVGD